MSDALDEKRHAADDCPPSDRCEYCGCCVHGYTLKAGCKVDLAPAGMRCPNELCGCEGWA